MRLCFVNKSSVFSEINNAGIFLLKLLSDILLEIKRNFMEMA